MTQRDTAALSYRCVPGRQPRGVRDWCLKMPRCGALCLAPNMWQLSSLSTSIQQKQLWHVLIRILSYKTGTQVTTKKTALKSVMAGNFFSLLLQLSTQSTSLMEVKLASSKAVRLGEECFPLRLFRSPCLMLGELPVPCRELGGCWTSPALIWYKGGW